METIRSHIKNVLLLSNKKSLKDLVFSADFVKLLFHFGPGHSVLVRANTGKLIGTDQFGNRYFEDTAAQYTRRRWVAYANYHDHNPTTVPAEWHGWLNYLYDYAPGHHEFKQPIYAIEAEKTKTGTSDYYMPKGAWQNEHKRNWKKYQAWTPPGLDPIAVKQGTDQL